MSRGDIELSSVTAEVLSQSNSIQTHSYIERKHIVNTLYLHSVRVPVNVFFPGLGFDERAAVLFSPETAAMRNLILQLLVSY